jgi:tetratricopeptide (TPR) repeat protein
MRANNLDLAGAVVAGERARALAAGTGDDGDMAIAIDGLKLAALQLGDLQQLAALTAQLEEIQRRNGDLWYLQWTLLESSFVPMAQARWDPARSRLREALAFNTRVGDTFGAPMIHDAICWLERSCGEFGRALTEGRLAAELGSPGDMGAAWARATLGWTLLDLRAPEEAAAVLADGLTHASTLSTRFRLAGHLAWAHALAGDNQRAVAAADEAQRAYAHLSAPAGGAFVFGFAGAANLARAHRAAGRPERGAALLDPLLLVARESGWHEAAALVSLVLGLCVDADAARLRLREALDIAAEHGLPGVEWEACAALADLSPAPEAAALRARSAALVHRLADGIGDADLAAGFVRAAEG